METKLHVVASATFNGANATGGFVNDDSIWNSYNIDHIVRYSAGDYGVYFTNPFLWTVKTGVQLTADQDVNKLGYLTCHVVARTYNCCELMCVYQEHAYEDGILHFLAYDFKVAPA
jgi:hypothetical protein